MKRDLEEQERITEILKALANVQRLNIVQGLSEDGCNVKKIMKNLNIPQSTASSYLSKLRSAGIIKGKRNGTEICYTLEDPMTKELLSIIKRYMSG